MWLEYFLFILGIYALVKGSDFIVEGASALAERLGVSHLIIGLTIVAFGTSLPELVVNGFAVFVGSSELVFGNIIGSNITNIFLALGLTAIIGRIKLMRSTVWNEIPFALLAAFVLYVLVSKGLLIGGGSLTVFDSLILLGLLSFFIFYIFKLAKKEEKGKKEEKEEYSGVSLPRVIFKLLSGMFIIYFGGKWTVDGAVFIANQFGMSEFLISATIIAIGTSLPELAVCVIAAVKKKVDLAVGNIVGSNVFNILWVLGVLPLLGPLPIPSFILIDIGIMFLATLMLFVLMFIGRVHELRKNEGILFLLSYVAYIIFLIHRG